MRIFDEPPGGGAPSDRSASGLLEWESVSDAMEALALINHYQMKNASKSWTHISPHIKMQLSDVKRHHGNCLHLFSAGPYPYTLKLCFSTVQHNN